MIRWSAITLRAGVIPHGGIKEKDTRIDKDNEGTRGGMKRRCYMYVPCTMYTHTYVAQTEKQLQCAHKHAEEKERRDREGTEGGTNGKKQSLKSGEQGARDAREREKDSGEEEFTEGGGRGRERERRGTEGAEGTEESRRRQKRGSRILTKRWGMSRRVVCSHGSSLGTAVQYAGQGKVTLLCVRACASARLLTVPHTITHIHVYIRHYRIVLSL